MINLFEYQNKVEFEGSTNELEGFLDEIWRNRERNSFYQGTDEDKIEYQKFIHFFRNSNEIKSNKYVGVIHFQGEKINLLPKIFFEPGRTYSDNEIYQIHNHVLWWLSYCRKIKFPNYIASLGSSKNNFFEILIYLYSKYTRELLNSSIYKQYEEVNRELPYIKGRLNSGTYISQNLSKGKWHKLNCIYDAFVLDNEFNRIIKYVTNLLFNTSTNQENKKYLREILFILDDVSDSRATPEQCLRIEFNPMFEGFKTVRDYCYLFLDNSISFNYKDELNLFAFLLPMEYVFEDFVFGFIDKEVDAISANPQRSDVYLDETKIFNVKPDLWLKTKTKSFIADTKYKIVYSDQQDPKKGVSQSDLYQMIAYAIRFEVDEVILFYPNTIRDNQDMVSEIKVKDRLAHDREITIKAFQLPIINKSLLDDNLEINDSLDKIFESTRETLKKSITGTMKK